MALLGYVSFSSCLIYCALAIAFMIIMSIIGIPLRTEQTPMGIVSFEFPLNAQNALRMLQAWDGQTQNVASFQIGLDFLFIVLYVLAIANTCYFVSATLAHQWPRYKQWILISGRMLATAQLFAGALDAIENVGMMYILYTQDAPHVLPALITCCAFFKFLFVLLGAVFGLMGLAVVIVLRWRNKLQRANYTVQQDE